MPSKLFILLFAIFSVTLNAGDYNFLALGDLHYDGRQYHTSPPQKKHQKNERKRNLAMWKNGKSVQLLSSAGKAANNNVRFIVQLGDFTQGDCDTEALQEKMFKDGFAKVKKYFPNHKLLAVKGNHDVRLLSSKGNSNAPAAKAFLPLIANELNRSRINGNYALTHDRDLYIFFDDFDNQQSALEFVGNTLRKHHDSRYTFFLTHLPLLPCSAGNPAWTVSVRDKLIPMLARRNAIILAAHTHVPSFISLKTPHGNLTQLVLCSIGSQWDPQAKPAVKWKDFETFCQHVPQDKMQQNSVKKLLQTIKSYPAEHYKIYTSASGFAVIKVTDKAVTADIYANNSGKPWISETLRTNTAQ